MVVVSKMVGLVDTATEAETVSAIASASHASCQIRIMEFIQDTQIFIREIIDLIYVFRFPKYDTSNNLKVVLIIPDSQEIVTIKIMIKSMWILKAYRSFYFLCKILKKNLLNKYNNYAYFKNTRPKTQKD